jgi:hypothetical protein
MKKYAVLNDKSEVTNIINAASLEIAESVTSSYCVLVSLGTFVDIGYVYADGSFSVPVVAEVPELAPAPVVAVVIFT